MNKYKIGINIGSETIECGVVKSGQVEIVNQNEGGSFFTIYVFYSPKSTEIRVGGAAKSVTDIYPSQIVYDVLKLIGVRYNDIELQENMKQWKFKVINEGGEAKVELKYNNRMIHLSGIEILSEILKYIKRQADESCGNDVNLKTECVISIPSYLTDFQRICIIDACERVNLKVLETASSSICANIGYNYYTKSSKDNRINLVFILDSGGLIIDLIKYNIDYSRNIMRILSSKHDKELNMNKIVNNVCSFYNNQYKRATGELLNNTRLFRLRNECEQAISTLCVEGYDKTILDVHFLEDEGIDTELSIYLFNTLNNDIFKRIIDITKASIYDIGLHSSDIDNVILVGCGSRIKRIREMLKEIYHSSYIENYYNPEKICAEGAVVIANNYDGYKIIDRVEKRVNFIEKWNNPVGYKRKEYLRNIIDSLNGIINDIKSNEFISIIKEVNSYVRSEKSDIRMCDEYLSKIEVYKYIYIILL